MTREFTTLQLFSLVDGRLSTSIEDVYDMLNHICDTPSLMTHHLPVALDYLKLKNPQWFQVQSRRLQDIARAITGIGPDSPINLGDVDFDLFIQEIKDKYNDTVSVPQLKDEFDTSDFGQYMVDNALFVWY